MRQNININMVENSSQLHSAALDNGHYLEIFYFIKLIKLYKKMYNYLCIFVHIQCIAIKTAKSGQHSSLLQ